jgi:GT2 family glycosyltransferase
MAQSDQTVSTTPAPSLAVVIVNYRTPDLAMACVDSLMAERDAIGRFDVVLVDGHSPDDSVARLTAHFSGPQWRDWVSVLPLPMNGGFGWANNQAMLRLLQRPQPPDYILLLNPDCAVEPGALRALLDTIAANPELGAVGSQLLEPDGQLAGSAFRFPSPGREFTAGSQLGRLSAMLGILPTQVACDAPGPAEWVTGASVLFRAEALRRTGLFDDGFFLYFEEVELMHRMAQAGWRFWTVPQSRVMHIGGAATGVASGNQLARRPHPPYRFESRRRYFMRTGGLAALLAANLAWLAGWLVGLPVALLSRSRKGRVPREFAMTIGLCFWPRAQDYRASIPQWNEPPGRPPAWSAE